MLGLVFATQSSYAFTFNCDQVYRSSAPAPSAFFKGELQFKCVGTIPGGSEYVLSFDHLASRSVYQKAR